MLWNIRLSTTVSECDYDMCDIPAIALEHLLKPFETFYIVEAISNEAMKTIFYQLSTLQQKLGEVISMPSF